MLFEYATDPATWVPTVVAGAEDTLLTNALTIYMPDKTAQWVVRKESDNSLVYDSGVFDMYLGADMDEVAGFFFQSQYQPDRKAGTEHESYYGWTNPAYNPSKPGDVNRDYFVGGADLTQVIFNWDMGDTPSWSDGDIAPFPGGDDIIGGADYTAVISNWGTSYGLSEPGPVPEPAALCLFALVGLSLVRRRR